MPKEIKKDVDVESLFKDDIHAEVEEVLNKNIITDEDIEKYKMNRDSSLTAGEFIDLINHAFKTNTDKEKIVQEVISE